MTSPKNTIQLCNRREFLIASGLVVAGNVLSCGSQPARQTIGKTIVPTTPTQIRVRIGKNIQQLTIGNKTISISGVGDSPKTIEIKPNTKITIGNKTKILSGIIQLHPKKVAEKDTLDVVAHIPMEQYLPGVLAGELYAHWHQTTFIAQAVAARSYASAQCLERKNTSYFDVDDGPSSQMFLGQITLDVAHRAVQESSSIVLTWNNNIIPSYYCACCGGVAATALDAISPAQIHNVPPLLGREGTDLCKSLKIHKWSVARPSRTTRKRINRCAKTMNVPEFLNVHTIRSIEPIETNKHGRPTRLAIYDRRNKATEVKAKDFVRAINTNVSSLPKPTPRVWSSNLVAKKDGSNIQFDGTGMGHGVGLCQYGAQELASRGESWEDILMWYYPDVDIKCTL